MWQQAYVIEDLHIIVSNEFRVQGECSRVEVVFDDNAIYFATRFYDREPDKVIPKVLPKSDISLGDDSFTVTLDPLDQGRSGWTAETASSH